MGAVKNLIEGKPIRSPLHPALVHLPIALFPLSAVLDVGTWILDAGSANLVRAAYWLIVAGIVTGLVAGVVGMVDYSDIRKDHPAKKQATLHMILNLVALAVFAAGAWLRHGRLDETTSAVLPFVVSLVGLGLISYSGYIGGHLVYSDGIGVGRHRRRTDTPEDTIEVRPRDDGAVAVASEDDLGEGETLRVKVSGVVMTIARIDGALYGFQEFCTHRYGPLSEGALQGCEVVCPWHNSKFDVRTGKVTGGPAKVDLRTFKVQSREGKIWVTV